NYYARLHNSDTSSPYAKPLSVSIIPCNSYYCVLQRGRSTTFEITFQAYDDLLASGVEVLAIFKTVMMVVSLPDADVCDRLNPPCPVRAGQTYTYRYTTTIDKRFPLGNVSDAGSNGKWMCWQTQALQNACDLMKCGNGFKTILVLRRRSRTITIKAFTAVLNISKCSLYSDVSFYKPSNIPDCEYPQQHQPELSSALELSH
ncbi:hypothetical protein CLF_103124, partial [Clonorchis sinensis]